MKQTGKFDIHGVFAILLVLCSLSACSTAKNRPAIVNGEDSDLLSFRTSLGSFVEIDRAEQRTRKTNSIRNSVGLTARMLLVDPLVRPVTTLTALSGVTLKSATGLVDRSRIETLGLPRLERLPIPEIADNPPMDIEAWERELDDLTGAGRSSGSIRFLVDGEAYFTRLEEVIAQAQRSVDIRSYIFDNDDVSLKIAALLRAKSELADVRILVDGLADIFAPRLDSHSMPDDILLPSSISGFLTYESNVDFRKQSNPWFTGDHAKITVVDGSTAFIGGMNIGREYRYDWHDLMMEVEGPIVDRLQFEFDKNWARSGWLGDLGWFLTAMKGHSDSNAAAGIPIRLLKTTVLNSQLYRAQILAIRRARQRVYIQNAYFSDDKILYELARARLRGVDVRVILSADNDSGVLDLSNQKTVATMLRHGIRVYIYPGMTHVKAAIYDGWACLGSANFDKLSLQINEEINLAFSDPATVENLLAQVFYPDFARSAELHEAPRLETRHHLAEMIADELF